MESRGRISVLVVDERLQISKAIAENLQLAGYEPTFVDSAQALLAIREESYETVLINAETVHSRFSKQIAEEVYGKPSSRRLCVYYPNSSMQLEARTWAQHPEHPRYFATGRDILSDPASILSRMDKMGAQI